MPTLPTAAVIGAGSSGIAAAKALHERGVPFTCFEASDRVGGNWVFANKNGDVGRLSPAVHQHLARPHGVLGLPDAEVLSGLPAPHADRGLLRRLRRALRLPRPHPLRDQGRARPTRGRRGLGARRSTTARSSASTRCSSPTATTGTRAGPSRCSPATRASPASSSTPMPTSTTTSSPARTSSSSAWATRRWTSRSSRPTWRARPTWPPVAGRGSSPSTCSADRSTSCRRTRASPSRSASA